MGTHYRSSFLPSNKKRSFLLLLQLFLCFWCLHLLFFTSNCAFPSTTTTTTTTTIINRDSPSSSLFSSPLSSQLRPLSRGKENRHQRFLFSSSPSFFPFAAAATTTANKNTCERIERCGECVYDSTDGLMPPVLSCGWCADSKRCLSVNDSILAQYTSHDAATNAAVKAAFCQDLRHREYRGDCPDMSCAAATTTNNIYICRASSIAVLVLACVLFAGSVLVYFWVSTVRQLPWRYEPMLSYLMDASSNNNNKNNNMVMNSQRSEEQKQAQATLLRKMNHNNLLLLMISRILAATKTTCQVATTAAASSEAGHHHHHHHHHHGHDGSAARSPTTEAAALLENGPAVTTYAINNMLLPSVCYTTAAQLAACVKGRCPICKRIKPSVLGPGEVCVWCNIARMAFLPMTVAATCSVLIIFFSFSIALKPWFADWYYWLLLVIGYGVYSFALLYVLTQRQLCIRLFRTYLIREAAAARWEEREEAKREKAAAAENSPHHHSTGCGHGGHRHRRRGSKSNTHSYHTSRTASPSSSSSSSCGEVEHGRHPRRQREPTTSNASGGGMAFHMPHMYPANSATPSDAAAEEKSRKEEEVQMQFAEGLLDAENKVLISLQHTYYIQLAWRLRGRSLFTVFPELLPFKNSFSSQVRATTNDISDDINDDNNNSHHQSSSTRQPTSATKATDVIISDGTVNRQAPPTRTTTTTTPAREEENYAATATTATTITTTTEASAQHIQEEEKTNPLSYTGSRAEKTSKRRRSSPTSSTNQKEEKGIERPPPISIADPTVKTTNPTSTSGTRTPTTSPLRKSKTSIVTNTMTDMDMEAAEHRRHHHRSSAANDRHSNDSSTNHNTAPLHPTMSRSTTITLHTTSHTLPDEIRAQKEFETARLTSTELLDDKVRRALKDTLLRDELILWCCKPELKHVARECDWLLLNLFMGVLFGGWLVLLSMSSDTSFAIVRLTQSTTPLMLVGLLFIFSFLTVLVMTLRGCSRLYILTNERLITIYDGIMNPVVTFTELHSLKYASINGFNVTSFNFFSFFWKLRQRLRQRRQRKSREEAEGLARAAGGETGEQMTTIVPPASGSGRGDAALSTSLQANANNSDDYYYYHRSNTLREPILTFSWEIPATERKMPPIRSHNFVGIADIHAFLFYFNLVSPKLPPQLEQRSAALRHDRLVWQQSLVLCTVLWLVAPLFTLYPQAVPGFLAFYIFVLLCCLCLSMFVRGLRALRMTHIALHLAVAWDASEEEEEEEEDSVDRDSNTDTTSNHVTSTSVVGGRSYGADHRGGDADDSSSSGSSGSSTIAMGENGGKHKRRRRPADGAATTDTTDVEVAEDADDDATTELSVAPDALNGEVGSSSSNNNNNNNNNSRVVNVAVAHACATPTAEDEKEKEKEKEKKRREENEAFSSSCTSTSSSTNGGRRHHHHRHHHHHHQNSNNNNNNNNHRVPHTHAHSDFSASSANGATMYHHGSTNSLDAAHAAASLSSTLHQLAPPPRNNSFCNVEIENAAHMMIPVNIAAHSTTGASTNNPTAETTPVATTLESSAATSPRNGVTRWGNEL